MRHSSEAHNLARLRVLIGEKQGGFAKVIGCSIHTLQSIETCRLQLRVELALRVSVETGVHLDWLMINNLHAPIVRFADAMPYSKADYEEAQAQSKIGAADTIMEELSADYAASFYGQIRAILSSAVKKDRGELATWKIAKFLDDCRAEFGHDRSLIPKAEQFGLRPDNSPYLKFRQIEAGIALFRKYDHERDAIIQEGLRKPQKRKATSAAQTLTLHAIKTRWRST